MYVQVICVGDFYQLSPVPNALYDDDGQSLVDYKSIDDFIPHRFILKEVYRQTEG